MSAALEIEPTTKVMHYVLRFGLIFNASDVISTGVLNKLVEDFSELQMKDEFVYWVKCRRESLPKIIRNITIHKLNLKLSTLADKMKYK